MTPRARWMAEGHDPDPRYSLANERTFLAWVRTSLAFAAGAVAVLHVVPPFAVPGARTALGAVLAVAGLVTAVLAYWRWRANERALRLGRPVTHPRGLLVVASAVVIVAVVVLAVLPVGYG